MRHVPLTLATLLLIAMPAFAENPRRAVQHPGTDPNVRMIWVAEAFTSWEDAAAAFVSSKGNLSILRTGDLETPFVVLRQIPSGSYAAFPPPKYITVTFNDMVSAMPFTASMPWWRGLTIEDGSALIVTRNQ